MINLILLVAAIVITAYLAYWRGHAAALRAWSDAIDRQWALDIDIIKQEYEKEVAKHV